MAWAWGGGGGGGFGFAQPAAAPVAEQKTEKVPTDAIDRTLYYLDRACAAGAPANNPNLKPLLETVTETAEKPLTRIRELLRPYRKTEEHHLDKIQQYAFRAIIWERRDAEPRIPDKRLMTDDEWKEKYGENPKDVRRYAENIPELAQFDLRYPLQPVAVEGFAGLGKRLQIQQEALTGLQAGGDNKDGKPGALQTVQLAIMRLEGLQGQATKTKQRIEQCRQRSREQLSRLLRVAQKTEMVAFPDAASYGGVGGGAGMGGYGMVGYGGAGGASRAKDENREEQALRAKLLQLLQALHEHYKLAPRLEALQQTVGQIQQRALLMGGAGGAGAGAGQRSAPGAAPPAAVPGAVYVDYATQAELEHVREKVKAMKREVEEGKRQLEEAARRLREAGVPVTL